MNRIESCAKLPRFVQVFTAHAKALIAHSVVNLRADDEVYGDDTEHNHVTYGYSLWHAHNLFTDQNVG